MVAGVMDRKASTAAYFVYNAGDILRACPSGAAVGDGRDWRLPTTEPAAGVGQPERAGHYDCPRVVCRRRQLWGQPGA